MARCNMPIFEPNNWVNVWYTIAFFFRLASSRSISTLLPSLRSGRP